MNLKDFIKQTIVEIGEAMQESHANLVAKGGRGIEDIHHTKIHFDVAVSVDEQSEKSGGGKIGIAHIVTVGGDAQSLVKNSSVSRIEFDVEMHAKTGGNTWSPSVA